MTVENIDSETQEVLDQVLPDPDVEILADEDPSAEKAPIAAATSKQPRVRQMTAAEIAQKQKEARVQGQKTLRDAWNAKAKEKGFSSVEEMFSKVADPKEPDSAAQVRINSPKVQAELNQKDALIMKLQRENKRLQQQLDARDTELSLRHTAYEAGALPDDVEYVTSQLHKTWSTLPAEEQKSFEPKKYLEGLKTKKPHLFGGGVQQKVEEILVGTTPTNGNAPKGPTAGQVKVEEATAQAPKDMRKLSKQEYLDEMSRRGWKNPASMV